jgi:hypothetical protein
MRRETWFWLLLLLAVVLIASSWDHHDALVSEKILKDWRAHGTH